MEEINTSVYDIIVIGAGPAGSIFVSELAKARPDLKILILDGQKLTSAKPVLANSAPIKKTEDLNSLDRLYGT